MKRIATINSIKTLVEVLPYLDGVIVGHEAYATRLSGHFSLADIKEACFLAEKANKAVYVSVNKLFHPTEIPALRIFLHDLKAMKITGLLFGDVGLIEIAKELQMTHLLVYQPDTLVTNIFDFNFLHTEGILGAFVSKEIVLDDILAIAEEKKHPLFMIGHGYLNMFHSKRELLSAYKTHTHLAHEVKDKRTLTLKEETRQSAYPIVEDSQGTHIFRENVFASLAYLKDLEPHVDVLVIDTIFMQPEDIMFIVKLYELGSLDLDQALQMVKPYLEKTKQTWDDGFLHKKTVYKKVNA